MAGPTSDRRVDPVPATGATGTPTAREPQKQQAVLAAIGLMLFAGACSSMLHIGVRYLSPHLPTAQIVFLRAFFSALVLLPVIVWVAPTPPWHTNRLGLQVWRGIVGVASITTWYYALGQMPLADAGALSFTTGLFVTLGAALYFREAVGPRRWTAVIVGFVGALIVLRPGAGVVSLAAISAVVSSALWALSMLMSKELTKHDTSLTITFFQPMLITPIGLLMALPVWVWPPTWCWLLLAAMGAVAALGNYCYVQAFRFADVSVSMPADYVRLVWMAAWGYLFFAEIPGVATWVGAVLIIGATFFITWRESHLAAERRRATAPPATPSRAATPT